MFTWKLYNQVSSHKFSSKQERLSISTQMTNICTQKATVAISEWVTSYRTSLFQGSTKPLPVNATYFISTWVHFRNSKLLKKKKIWASLTVSEHPLTVSVARFSVLTLTFNISGFLHIFRSFHFVRTSIWVYTTFLEHAIPYTPYTSTHFKAHFEHIGNRLGIIKKNQKTTVSCST